MNAFAASACFGVGGDGGGENQFLLQLGGEEAGTSSTPGPISTLTRKYPEFSFASGDRRRESAAVAAWALVLAFICVGDAEAFEHAL